MAVSIKLAIRNWHNSPVMKGQHLIHCGVSEKPYAVTVEQLVEAADASPATIRRDFDSAG